MSNVRATSPGPQPSGRRRHPADQGPQVPSITSAPEPLADDQARRTRRYLVQMGVRLVFFLAAVSIYVGGWAPVWVMWAMMAAAVVLPYSAVLFANAGRDRTSYDTSPVTEQARTALPAAGATRTSAPAEHAEPAAWSPADGHDGHTVVEHGVAPDDENDENDDDPAGGR